MKIPYKYLFSVEIHRFRNNHRIEDYRRNCSIIFALFRKRLCFSIKSRQSGVFCSVSIHFFVDSQKGTIWNWKMDQILHLQPMKLFSV